MADPPLHFECRPEIPPRVRSPGPPDGSSDAIEDGAAGQAEPAVQRQDSPSSKVGVLPNPAAYRSDVSLDHDDDGLRGVAEPQRALGDRIQHRPHVAGGAGDHAQDLADRGLLLERLLGLVEKPHVLDRDGRLIGEGLHQRDLLVA